ncbi:adenylate/guanylate cyclase domain-containing protein [Motiliproteus sediminis]|uniref:adenylate/guanylate cyclase domain-containing protein n=1 Tax=Motiliproteus sediminis TaxID=1468178 RepID=UPI001FE66909|nr:adenylate/guanylate cyclase domain-containing protein [Motiliproteus sediminis]
MQTGRLSLTWVLAATFGLLLTLAFSLLFYFGVSAAEQGVRGRLTLLADAAIAAVEDELADQLQPVEVQLEYLASDVRGWRLPLQPTERLVDSLNGALAATPQLRAIAYFSVGGEVTVVSRDPRPVHFANWRQRNQNRLAQWLSEMPRQPSWEQPVWSQLLRAGVLPRLQPVWQDDRFQGLLVAVVGADNLSYFLNRLRDRIGATPFVLLGERQLLAYPELGVRLKRPLGPEHPLPLLTDMDDIQLQSLYSPRRQAVRWHDDQQWSAWRVGEGNRQTLYLQRTLDRYGTTPWVLGVYQQFERPGIFNGPLRGWWLGGALLLVVLIALLVVISRRLGGEMAALERAFARVERQPVADIAPLAGSAVAEFDGLARAYNRMLVSLRDKERVEALFGRYLPQPVATELMRDGGFPVAQQAQATVLFCDLEGFTALSERLQPAAIIGLLNAYFAEVVAIVEAHQGVITQFQGDAILAVYNVPVAVGDHASKALATARLLQQLTDQHEFGGHRLRCRVGINTGSLVAGSVGAPERLSYTVHGDAVNLAARLEAMNKELGTRILVSESTAEQVGYEGLQPVGEMPVRGRSATVRLYTVAKSGDEQSIVPV